MLVAGKSTLMPFVKRVCKPYNARGFRIRLIPWRQQQQVMTTASMKSLSNIYTWFNQIVSHGLCGFEVRRWRSKVLQTPTLQLT